MEVILLEKIRNLGDIGSQVKVKPGYARNFLFPQGKATTANPANIAKFETQRVELEAKEQVLLQQAQTRAEKLAQVAVTIAVRASEEGKLFGSVGIREIIAAVEAVGEEIDKKEVTLPEGPIHELGEYEINLQLHSDVVVPIKISIVAE